MYKVSDLGFFKEKLRDLELASPFDIRPAPVYLMILAQVAVGVYLIKWFDFNFNIPLIAAVSIWVLIAISGMLLRRLRFPRFGGAMEAFALLYGQGFASIPLIAALAAFAAPWADPILSYWDQAVGFSWHSAIDALMPFKRILEICYDSFIWQGWVLIVLLSYYSLINRMWILVCAATMSLIVCSAIFAWMPAKAAYVYYGFEDFSGSHVPFSFLEPLTYIREGGRELTSSIISGMVSFPSYHATSAIIFTWAAWKTPFRLLFLLLNAGLLLGTILIGGHYLSDLLAGVLLAWATLTGSSRLIAYLERRTLRVDDCQSA